jgi:hypothetical protein
LQRNDIDLALVLNDRRFVDIQKGAVMIALIEKRQRALAIGIGVSAGKADRPIKILDRCSKRAIAAVRNASINIKLAHCAGAVATGVNQRRARRYSLTPCAACRHARTARQRFCWRLLSGD